MRTIPPILAIVLAASTSLFAGGPALPTSYELQVTMIDAATNLPAQNVEVVYNNQTYTTDNNGVVTVEVPFYNSCIRGIGGGHLKKQRQQNAPKVALSAQGKTIKLKRDWRNYRNIDSPKTRKATITL